MTGTIYSKSAPNTIINVSASRDGKKILLALVVLLFVLARLWRLTSSCLWFDEIFSVHVAEHSWATLTHFVAADLVHPPLFYILLKFWIGVGGESLPWLRSFPAITSIAAVGPVVLLARELNLTRTETALALLLLSVNGYLIKYAQEVRMYSLLFFLSTCSLWLFVSVLRKESGAAKRRLVWLTAVNLLMIYTHYYGWLMVALQLVTVLLLYRRRVKLFIISFAILVAAYIPWILQISRAYEAARFGQNIGWIPRPGVGALIEYVTLLNQPFVFPESSADNRAIFFVLASVLLSFAFPLAVLIWQTFKQRQAQAESRPLILLTVFAFAPVMAVATLSWILPQSIWGTRHLIIGAAPYCLLMAMAIARLRPYWAKVAVSLVLGCWFLVVGVYAVIRPVPNFIWCAWTPLAQQLTQVTPPPSRPVAVYAFEDLVAYHLWFALRNSTGVNYRIAVIKGVPGTHEDPAYFLPRDFNEVSIYQAAEPTEDEIWIAFRGASLDQNGPPLNHFMSAGYQTERVLTMRAQNQDAFLVQLRRK